MGGQGRSTTAHSKTTAANRRRTLAAGSWWSIPRCHFSASRLRATSGGASCVGGRQRSQPTRLSLTSVTGPGRQADADDPLPAAISSSSAGTAARVTAPGCSRARKLRPEAPPPASSLGSCAHREGTVRPLESGLKEAWRRAGDAWVESKAKRQLEAWPSRK